MHTNRISRHLDELPAGKPAGTEARAPVPAAFVVVTGNATAASVYEAAYRRAVVDHQIDRLFNPEYYGD